MKIDPVPEGLDDGDDPGRKRDPGHSNHGVIVAMSKWETHGYGHGGRA